MKSRRVKNEKVNEKNSNKLEEDLPGYPPYPPKEDIYNTEEEADLNPDDLTRKKDILKFTESQEIRDLTSGDDLDVPGAELDDQMEFIGDEDEENNYYSLGGDDHENLEEDNIDEENEME